MRWTTKKRLAWQSAQNEKKKKKNELTSWNIIRNFRFIAFYGNNACRTVLDHSKRLKNDKISHRSSFVQQRLRSHRRTHALRHVPTDAGCRTDYDEGKTIKLSSFSSSSKSSKALKAIINLVNRLLRESTVPLDFDSWNSTNIEKNFLLVTSPLAWLFVMHTNTNVRRLRSNEMKKGRNK